MTIENRITIRDFTRNIYKYIKVDGIYTVGVRGSKDIVVTIRGNKEKSNVVTINELDAVDNVVTKNTGVRQDRVKDVVTSGSYGCGCEREVGKVMCSKHKRI